jgi:hypothetical protein
MRTSSVHGIGMREPVAAVAISADGRVEATGMLRPGRALRFPGAAWILELPAGDRLPDPGIRLVALVRS